MSKGSELRDRLRRQTGEASSRFAAVEDAISRRHRQPPQRGDLFVLPQTAEWPVEWAILDSDASRPPKMLAILVDIHSQVGSADVAVPAAAPRGAMTLRCLYAVWCDAEAFAPQGRTGFLDDESVEQALDKWRQVRNGAVTGSVDQREVDGESEYLDWVADVLQPARAAVLEGAAESATEAADETRGRVVDFRRPSRWSSISSPWGIAASILMVLTLGLGRQVVLNERQQQDTEEAHRQQMVRLSEDRQQAEAAWREDLSRLRAELEQTERQHRQRVAAFDASPRPRPMVNLPFAVLSSARTRSLAETLAVPDDADLVWLILRLEAGDPYPRYGLEIRLLGAPEILWSQDDLTTRGAELSLALPTSLLPPGDYQLRLSGLIRGRVQQLDEYLLSVENVSMASETAPSETVEDR